MTIRAVPFALLFGLSLAHCQSSAQKAGVDCASAGGTCILGGAACSVQAPDSAQDCNPPPYNAGGAFCCLDRGTSGTDASVDVHVDADSPACLISASSFDQSCTQDADCVAVGSGNACTQTCFNCARVDTAINVADYPLYMQALNAVPFSQPEPCNCSICGAQDQTPACSYCDNGACVAGTRN